MPCKLSRYITAQKIKFSIEDFFSKCDQIRRKLRIWSHLLKKSLTENFIFMQCIWLANHRNVFRIQCNTYDVVFCENCEQLKAVNYFRKKLHHRCSTALGSTYASGKHVLKLKNQNQHILSSSDNIQIVVHSHFYVHFSNNFPFWFRLKIFCLNLELR